MIYNPYLIWTLSSVYPKIVVNMVVGRYVMCFIKPKSALKFDACAASPLLRSA